MKNLSIAACAFLYLFLFNSAGAAEIIRVYGPGGPLPAVKEAATAFEKKTGVRVEVTGGPTDKWIASALENADVVYSGSETMMTDFVYAMNGAIDNRDVYPLYLRPLAMLVKPGNPKKIRQFSDMTKPGVKVLVVNGAGQNGVWEDAAGRLGNIETVRALRNNIVFYARNSAEAKDYWINHPDTDVWLIWNIWQVSNPELADAVPIESEYVIYRDTAVALTRSGKTRQAAIDFTSFLKSADGKAIYRKWGWITD